MLCMVSLAKCTKGFLPRGIHKLFHIGEGIEMRSQQGECRNNANSRALDTSIGLYGHVPTENVELQILYKDP